MPYSFDVTLYKIDGSTVLGSNAVQLTNKRTNERLTGTTNANGQVTFGASNFTSGYNDGDVVELKAKEIATGYKVNYRTRIDTANAGETIILILMNESYNWRKDFETGVFNKVIISDGPIPGEGLPVKTTQTTLISPIELGSCRDVNIIVHNDSAQVQTISVWVSDDAQPGTPGDKTFWALVNDATFTVSDSKMRAWTIPCSWVAITATSASAVTSGVRCTLKATT